MNSILYWLALVVAMATISVAHAQEKLGTLLIAGDITSCVKPHHGPELSGKEQRERDITNQSLI
jgi:hypothetical protein